MGQTGKQKPQWTQFSMICLDGGWCASKALGNGFVSGTSSHERALLAFTREHNRMAVLLANSDCGKKEGVKKGR